MSFQASWIHGNALKAENPENLNRIGYSGWGAEIEVQHGRGSWFHISLPTPVFLSDVRSTLFRVFLLFEAVPGTIRNVHIYDGSARIQEFNGLELYGEHRTAVDESNTFTLAAPYLVKFGIGVSFYYLADFGLGGSPFPPNRLTIASAGADYNG